MKLLNHLLKQTKTMTKKTSTKTLKPSLDDLKPTAVKSAPVVPPVDTLATTFYTQKATQSEIAASSICILRVSLLGTFDYLDAVPADVKPSTLANFQVIRSIVENQQGLALIGSRPTGR